MPNDQAPAAEQADVVLAVEANLADGWRPARHQEHTWTRALAELANEDRDLVEVIDADTETKPMTADEEQALITRQWSGD